MGLTTRRLSSVISLSGILVLGCAFDLAHVKYTTTTLQSIQEPGHTLVLTDEVSLAETPCYSRSLRKATRWDQVGTIQEGEVFRSKDQVLTLECSNVHEAYMVISQDTLVGFFLPVERGFVPYSPAVLLPIGK